ncbi:MAG TPA: C4-dicarboxylate ABC transporter, partial [Rhodospirillaceae bacterium]|nr:C4-dicarboxylate ABC transporter [Rhodospirillaceae bacterium]
ALWLIDVQKRGIHLAFALLLCFLMFPVARKYATRPIPFFDVLCAIVGCLCALYLFFGYEGLVARQGVLLNLELAGLTIPFEAILGAIGIGLLLEGTRRSIGLPLVLVASVFLLFSVFGQRVELVICAVGLGFGAGGFYLSQVGRRTFGGVMMGVGLVILLYAFLGSALADILAHKGVSLTRLIGYQWLGAEAIFGIPIDVSVSFVFLFVLFGALLERAGAGQYFLDLAFAMVGKYRGGPAKAAILASGMTGAISGSSIANVVTTGTFTIPVMRQTGIPAVKAGAIEVAASTNGQIMPPIMGAAAFIIAELVGISYFDVVVAAFIPAVVSYLALLYISHLEALKLNLSGLSADAIPHLKRTFIGGAHFMIPIVVLIYLLMIERWSASSAVFYSIVWMMLVMVSVKLLPKKYDRSLLVVPLSIPVLFSALLRWGMGFKAIDATLWGLAGFIVVIAGLSLASAKDGEPVIAELKQGLLDIYDGMVTGARNMITIGIAVAAAGIIVGSVSSTGLNIAMVGVVEAISGGNLIILLLMTAIMSLILGMGLPTTANYLVVASLLAGVLVELGSASGLVLPLIAVHLYVFYFGILADDTPPVCLAAFAAAAISRADPIKTGIQGFTYDIRTAILPFMFLFNPELLLIGVTSFWHGLVIFIVALIAMMSFSAAIQGWMLVRANVVERVLLLVVTIMLFRPDFVLDQFSPAWADIDLRQYAAGSAKLERDRNMRIHVTRETDYGDRYKLYVIPVPATGSGPAAIGAKFEPVPPNSDEAKKGDYQLGALSFTGAAGKVGLKRGDIVTGVSVEQLDRPAKEFVYPAGFLILGLVILLQWRRRENEQEAP